MTPVITKQKDARGRIVGYSAHIGQLMTEGKTAIDARNAFNDATRDALERLEQGPYIGRELGVRFMVSPTINGWTYWLETFSSNYSAPARRGATRDSAINDALFHVGQNTWTLDVSNDDAFVELAWRKGGNDRRLELLSWIRWQRRYAAARAAGYDDRASHELASQGTTVHA